MARSGPGAAVDRPAAAPALALGIRLTRALQRCGDRESALRTLADVLSTGLRVPAAVWRMSADATRVDLVGDRGLSRGQHERMRRLVAPRSVTTRDRAATIRSYAHRVSELLGSSDVTALDVRCGLAIVASRFSDPASVGRELAAVLEEIPDLDVDTVRAIGRRRATARATEIDRLRSLSAREREVLALIGDGASTAEISWRLAISTKTVKTHVQNLLGKLMVGSRLEAAALARRAGLLTGS